MHHVPYMLTGSLASSMYGIPRATNDVDIVIAPTRDQLLSVVQMFQRVGLTVHTESALEAYRSRTQFNVIDFPKSLKADLILRQDRDFSVREFDRRETHEVEGMRLTLATPEDVLIAKLEWAKQGESERQIQDAAGILKMQRETLDLTGAAARSQLITGAPASPPADAAASSPPHQPAARTLPDQPARTPALRDAPPRPW
jgi:hypothetical protein